MALPSAGNPISLQQVNVELDLTATATINMGGSNVRTLFDDASGAISMSDGYGKSNAAYVAATGGTIVTEGDYKVHIFKSSGTFAVSDAGNAAGSNSVSALIVAGGGGANGGSWSGGYSGGGGAGGAGGGTASPPPSMTSLRDSYWDRPMAAPTPPAASFVRSAASIGPLEVVSSRSLALSVLSSGVGAPSGEGNDGTGVESRSETAGTGGTGGGGGTGGSSASDMVATVVQAADSSIQNWCVRHHHVERPPTVACTISPPSRGHLPSTCRSSK